MISLFGLIVGCEVGFWILLMAGLCARYLLHMVRLSNLLLICVPLLDIVLLIATAVDLSRGSRATFAHGLAAAYIGFSIAFGKLTVRWADTRFSYWFADGELPTRAPIGGMPLLVYEFKLWVRCALAVLITMSLVYLAIEFVGDHENTKPLELWYRLPLVILIPWLVFGPLWSLVFHWRTRGR